MWQKWSMSQSEIHKLPSGKALGFCSSSEHERWKNQKWIVVLWGYTLVPHICTRTLMQGDIIWIVISTSCQRTPSSLGGILTGAECPQNPLNVHLKATKQSYWQTMHRQSLATSTYVLTRIKGAAVWQPPAMCWKELLGFFFSHFYWKIGPNRNSVALVTLRLSLS